MANVLLLTPEVTSLQVNKLAPGGFPSLDIVDSRHLTVAVESSDDSKLPPQYSPRTMMKSAPPRFASGGSPRFTSGPQCHDDTRYDPHRPPSPTLAPAASPRRARQRAATTHHRGGATTPAVPDLLPAPEDDVPLFTAGQLLDSPSRRMGAARAADGSPRRAAVGRRNDRACTPPPAGAWAAAAAAASAKHDAFTVFATILGEKHPIDIPADATFGLLKSRIAPFMGRRPSSWPQDDELEEHDKGKQHWTIFGHSEARDSDLLADLGLGAEASVEVVAVSPPKPKVKDFDYESVQCERWGCRYKVENGYGLDSTTTTRTANSASTRNNGTPDGGKNKCSLM